MPLDQPSPVIGMTDDQVRAAAPSVFSLHPAPSVSDRYAYIPSYTVLRQMRLMGLSPVQVREVRTLQDDGKQFAMHEIRFRKIGPDWANQTRELGQIVPEVLLRNSHNRTSPMSFSAGLHRLICLNGMTVTEQGMSFAVRHLGRQTADQVHSGVHSILNGFSRTIEVARRWSGIQMSPELQRRFAVAALEIRGTALDVDPETVIRSQRPIDNGDDLWRVFNRAQENLTRGGMLSAGAASSRRRLNAITSLTRDVDLNRKLWQLASGVAEEIAPAPVAVVGEAAAVS